MYMFMAAAQEPLPVSPGDAWMPAVVRSKKRGAKRGKGN